MRSWHRIVTWAWLVAATGLGPAAQSNAKDSPARASTSSGLEFIRVSPDKRHLVGADSGREFRPWGFNYDHDAANRLLETYWKQEWPTVVQDFEEMKQLGANTVRIHLQVSHFMKSATETNPESLEQLSRLVALAGRTGLYLDVTGLGCYDKAEVPRWYDELPEARRWEVQARFWEAVAAVGSNQPAIFCYDLMNEPVVTEDKQGREWTPGAFGNRHFVQRLTLDFAGRTSAQIAEAWVGQMVAAIRKHDARHLVTVGAIPWALTFPGAKPLLYGPGPGAKLDFVSLHFYPKRNEVDQALKALAVYDLGKPIVIEEMFPLHCSPAELDRFIEGSKPLAVGWLGFYWGKSIAEYKSESPSIASELTREWLEYFARKTPEMVAGTTAKSEQP